MNNAKISFMSGRNNNTSEDNKIVMYIASKIPLAGVNSPKVLTNLLLFVRIKKQTGKSTTIFKIKDAVIIFLIY